MAQTTIDPTIIDIVKHYKKQLIEKKIQIKKMFLFGSQSRGDANKWSDIDVAVIAEDLSENHADNYVKLLTIVNGVDSRIEPHGFTPKDFEEKWNPFAREIKKHGIPI